MIEMSDKHVHGIGCMVNIKCQSTPGHHMAYIRMLELVFKPIRDLHRQINGPADDLTCSACSVDEYCYPQWPCDTIKLIDSLVPKDNSSEEDLKNSNCRRHYPGGRAYPINCWECYAEFRDDEREDSDDTEREHEEND